MGNSNQTNKQLYTPKQNISYVINHPILQNSQIIISKNIFKTTIVQKSQQQIKNWKKKIQQFNLINHDFIMLPLSVQIIQQGLCGNACSLSLLFKCYPYVLMDEILSRKRNNKQFQQDQMWYVIWALADASKKMMSKGTKLGDIRPHNILFNETGDVKITSLISWPNQLSNFQKTYYEKTKTYLSPEQLYCMTKGTKSDTTNIQLSQSFSIGLTLLSMLCYEDLCVLYQNDISLYGININKLKQKYQNLNKINYHSSYIKKRLPYSRGLIDLIKKLCCQDFQHRVNIVNIWNWLKPFQQDILSFKYFQLPRQISGVIISPTKTTTIQNQIPIFIVNNSLPATRLSTPMKIPISINYEQNQHSSSSLQFPYHHQTQYPIFIPGSTSSSPQYNPPILSTHLPNQQIYFQNSHPIISAAHNNRKQELQIFEEQKINSNQKQSFNNSKSSVQNFAFSQSYQQKSHAKLQKLNNNKNFEQFPNQKHNIKDITGQKFYTLGQQQDIIDIVDRQLSKSKRLFPPTPTQ